MNSALKKSEIAEKLENAFRLKEPPRRPSAWRRIAIVGMTVAFCSSLFLTIMSEGAAGLVSQIPMILVILVIIALLVGEDLYSGSFGGRFSEGGRLLRAVAVPMLFPAGAFILAAFLYDLAGLTVGVIAGISYFSLVVIFLVRSKHRQREKESLKAE